MFVFIVFFNQKTSYVMRISDWSSDVCSSDLGLRQHRPVVERERRIGADHGDAGKPRRDFDRLRLGERVGDVARGLPGGEERSGERLLVDMRGAGFEGQSGGRSEEHTSELQSLMRISYAVFGLKKKNKI